MDDDPPWRRSAMVATAQSAVRSRKTSFYAQCRRFKARRGVKRAILAVAHSMLVNAYYVIYPVASRIGSWDGTTTTGASLRLPSTN